MASLATSERSAPQVSNKIQKSFTSSSSSVRRDKEEQRKDRKGASQFFREAEKNRRQMEKLEKDRTFMVLSRRNGWTDVTEALEDYEREMAEDRRSEKLLLRKQLTKIKKEVRRFQVQLEDMNDDPQLLDHLKKCMSEAETSIHGLKEEQCTCFEELLKEERTCGQEVSAYERKIENWSLAVNSDVKHTSKALDSQSLGRDLPVGARSLGCFLKRGGSFGGWEKFDHEVFVKVWRKHGGQQTYRKEAKMRLPSKTLKDIEDHESWHQELVQLEDQKREAIQLWKVNKEMERHLKEEERKKERPKSNTHKVTEERKPTTRVLKEAKKDKDIEEDDGSEWIQINQSTKEEKQRQLEVSLMIEEHKRQNLI